jgi:hypothetical protein
MYATLTDTELGQLSTLAYRAGIRFYTAASEIFTRMGSLRPRSDEYEQLNRRAAVLLSAGREQSDLYSEIRDTQAGRRERNQAEAALRARIGAALADSITYQEMDEFERITAQDEADNA